MDVFQTIVADPPWKFSDQLPGTSRGAGKNYNCLAVQDIKEFVLPPVAEHARLFLWRVASMQEEALEVLTAWGFSLKSELVWVKKTKTGKPWFGMGHTIRGSHETCLIGVRGRPPALNHKTRSVFDAAVGRHSEKPEVFFDLVEQLSPGPYVELFARRKRLGWTCLGDEIR